MALTGMAIAAALALAKDELIDQPAAQRKRKLAAATAAYSPWTGMKPEEVNDPNVIGDMMLAGAGGAATGAAIGKANSESNLNNSLANNPNVSGQQLNTSAPNTALGGGQMSNQIGQNANNFSTNMNEKMVTAADSDPSSFQGKYAKEQKDPSWFYGNSPRAYASIGSPKNPWATLQDQGYSLTNPEDQWSINPFKPQSYGGR